MEELFSLIESIPFWFYEKIKLRKYQGKPRPNHFSNIKRNDIFYKKLEISLLPLLEKYDYNKYRKRIFIKENSNNISYIKFALNRNRNGLCVDYGEIASKIIKSSKKDLNYHVNNQTQFKRLKPSFWNYDYQYPVRKTDAYDDLIIDEIKILLKELILK